MLPWDCDMCEDTGRHRSYKVADGGGGRTVICNHDKS